MPSWAWRVWGAALFGLGLLIVLSASKGGAESGAIALVPFLWVASLFAFSMGAPPSSPQHEERLPWVERVRADYVEGRIEIEQLEEDLEYALGGRCPPRLRPQPLTIRRPGDRGVERVDG